MIILRIIIIYYSSGEQSWMPFGVERQAQFRKISGDLEETILTPPRRLAFPIIGTDKVRDRVGMGCTIHTLVDLQRKCKWQDQIQWDSMRWTTTWYKN